MSTSAHTAMNRRTFTAAAGVALATGAALASTARASEPAAAAYQTPRDPMAELWAGGYASEYADKVTAVEEADIVVVGAGVSGISAALEAAQQGVSVILLESQAIAGGNGGGKPDFAMAGIRDNTKIDEALAAVAGIVKAELEKNG